MRDDSRELSRVSVQPVDPDPAEYESIEVTQCIYCEDSNVVVAFVFIQPRGLRVAVPGRVGLCAECLALFRARDLEGVLGRTRRTSMADFEDAVILDLIRATVPAIAELPAG